MKQRALRLIGFTTLGVLVSMLASNPLGAIGIAQVVEQVADQVVDNPTDTQTEIPISIPGVVEVREAGGLDPATVSIVDEVVRAARADSTQLHRVTLRLLSITRGDQVVQQAPDGFGYPMLTSAVDPVAPVLAPKQLSALRSGEIVMGEVTARIRGAAVGDSIEMEALNGSVHTFRLGSVVPDADLRWSEIMVGLGPGSELGIDRPFGIVIWGNALPSLQAALRLALPQEEIRIYGPMTGGLDPDSVLPVAMVKERFGEFAIRPDSGDTVTVDAEWFDKWIVTVDFPIVGQTRCHRMVVPYIRAALSEIEGSGLAGAFDVGDFQVAGGCYNARFNRGADPGYSLSRHSWGIAIDFNPTDNPYGAEPNMAPAIVDVFRKWGFAWGGGWSVPDGMHFEWAHLPNTYSAGCADLTMIPDALTNSAVANSWLLAPAEQSCA